MNERDKYAEKLLQDNERKWKQIEANKAAKEATGTIVKNAVIGGVVAGPAGAVVGAIVGKTKVDRSTLDYTEQPVYTTAPNTASSSNFYSDTLNDQSLVSDTMQKRVNQ